jgi:integrase
MRLGGRTCAGRRPLEDHEVTVIAKSFSGVMAKRDNCLFILLIRTGYRISELLSLRVQDVQQHGKIVDKVAVARKAMKGGKAGKATGRTVLLHPEAKAALSVWLEVLLKRQGGTLAPETYIFTQRREPAHLQGPSLANFNGCLRRQRTRGQAGHARDAENLCQPRLRQTQP